MKRFRITEAVNVSGRVQVLPSGYNTDVTLVVKDNGDKEVIKVIGVKKSLPDEQTAREFTFDVVTYRDLLARVGNDQVPEITDAYLLWNKGENRWQVVYHMPYVGKDVGGIIKEAKDYAEIEEMLEKMLEFIGLFFNDLFSSPFEINVGIDPKPANFAILRNKVYFFDFVPPRYRKNNVAMVESPPPVTEQGFELGYFKHFDIRGILMILQSQLSRLRPEWRSTFKQLIIERAPDCAKGFLKDGIWNKFANVSRRKAKRIVADFTDRDIYIMREIVADLAEVRGYSSEEVDKFFRLSHFEDGIKTDRLLMLKSLLLTMHRAKTLSWPATM